MGGPALRRQQYFEPEVPLRRTPVRTRKPHIEDHRVDLLCPIPEHLVGCVGGRGAHDLEPVAEGRRKGGKETVVIFDNEERLSVGQSSIPVSRAGARYLRRKRVRGG